MGLAQLVDLGQFGVGGPGGNPSGGGGAAGNPRVGVWVGVEVAG